MTLSARTRVGQYEVLELLGAGGMGEVYRARDTRLHRDVALKVLPARLSSDPARLNRFDREARSASALNHPNIVTIYEVGQSESTSFIAMELVDGKTLRELLYVGPIPLRKLLGIAAQIADGLAKAHASGIVHRDVKPENVMVSSDGFVKMLDFGLAKLTHDSEQGQTIPGGTEPDVVMGTAGYMSPEQAAGQPVDFRTDQFSFGSILYEMLTGKPPFRRPTKPETLAAIIREEPEPIAALTPRVPAQIRWIVERCLAKEPRDRYAATEDLARDLVILRDHASDLSSEARISLEAPRRPARWRTIALGVALLAALTGTYLLGRRAGDSRPSPPRFRQLTFGSAGISSARFTPDGQTIVYAAQSEGKPSELFTVRADTPGERSLGLTNAEILSISSSGQMALLLTRQFGSVLLPPHRDIFGRDVGGFEGILAEAPLAGGTPRELLEGVNSADWSPDGGTLGIVRHMGGIRYSLEYPVGKRVANAVFARQIAISPTGDRVAFKAGSDLHVIEPGGQDRDLHEKPLEFAWRRATNEIWFNIVAGGSTDLFAVDPHGRKRRLTTLPGDFALHDISADGRVLVGRISESSEILGDFPDEPRPRSLSHLDRSVAVALAPGGDTLLFNELGQSGRRGVYLRPTDGSPPKRLGDGYGWALSPDGRLVLSSNAPGPQAFLVPTGAGEPRPLETPGIVRGGEMGFFPDGRRIWLLGREKGHGRRGWVQDLGGGKPRAFTPEDIATPVLSGDGRFLCAVAADGGWYLYSTETAESRKVTGLLPGERPFQWTADGKLLYVRIAKELLPGEPAITTQIHRLDPWTGRRELWKEIRPVQPLTGGAIGRILFSADGKTCVYTHHRYSSELFLVEGLR
jgi:eukaryotic-like serine/threonine-protein kinase